MDKRIWTLPTEIEIPRHTTKTLMNYVRSHVDLANVSEPFYMHVDQELCEEAFGDVLDTSTVTTAYIYAHDQPIPLHVDRYKSDAVLNLCVPLMRGDNDQFLLVFDQEFLEHGLSWRLEGIEHKQHRAAGPDHRNSSQSDNDHLPSEVWYGIRPCETNGVAGLTGEPLPQDLAKHLPYGQEEFYHGLSGMAWNWRTGHALAFRSSQIHGTGAQEEFKIGCVLLLNTDQLKLQDNQD